MAKITCPNLLQHYTENKILGMIQFSVIFFWFFASSLASLGFLMNDITLVIGSMLVSPVTKPLSEEVLMLVLGKTKNFIQPLITFLFLVVASLVFGFGSGKINQHFNKFEFPGKLSLNLTNIKNLPFSFLVGFMFGLVVSYSNLNDQLGPIIGFNIAVAVIPPLINSGLLFSYDGVKDDGEDYKTMSRNSLLIALANLAGIAVSLLIGFAIFC